MIVFFERNKCSNVAKMKSVKKMNFIFYDHDKYYHIQISKMTSKDEKQLTKQIISNLKKGKDNEALMILRENDRFLCLKSIKKIYDNLFCVKHLHHDHKECKNKNIDAHNTFHFLIYCSQHRYDLDISSDDNFAFKDACIHGRLGITKLLLNDPQVISGSQDLYNFVITEVCAYGHVEIVKLLLNLSHVDPSCDNNLPIIRAIICKHYEIVKLLLSDSRVDFYSSYGVNEVVDFAFKSGNLEIIKLLINDERFVDISIFMEAACVYGCLEIVEFLLNDKHINPNRDINFAFVFACREGHLEIVKILLNDKRTDPSRDNNKSLKYACYGGYLEIVKLLLDDSRIKLTSDLFDNLMNCKHDDIKIILRDKMNNI